MAGEMHRSPWKEMVSCLCPRLPWKAAGRRSDGSSSSVDVSQECPCAPSLGGSTSGQVQRQSSQLRGCEDAASDSVCPGVKGSVEALATESRSHGAFGYFPYWWKSGLNLPAVGTYKTHRCGASAHPPETEPFKSSLFPFSFPCPSPPPVPETFLVPSVFPERWSGPWERGCSLDRAFRGSWLCPAPSWLLLGFPWGLRVLLPDGFFIP